MTGSRLALLALSLVVAAISLAGCGKKAPLRPPDRAPTAEAPREAGSEASEEATDPETGDPATAEGPPPGDDDLTDLYDPILDRE